MSSVAAFRVRRCVAVNTGTTMKRISQTGLAWAFLLELVATVGLPGR
jgi:hypothetical protein